MKEFGKIKNNILKNLQLKVQRLIVALKLMDKKYNKYENYFNIAF